MKSGIRAVIVVSCTTHAACGGVAQQTQVERRRLTTGFTPAPSGPHATGPLVERGRIGLELGARATEVDGSRRRRDEGAAGNVVARLAEHGRVAVGVSGAVELGVEAEHTSVVTAKRIARDANYRELREDHVWRFGPQLRLRSNGDVRYGVTLELAGGMLAYVQTSIARARVTDYSTDPPTVTEREPIVAQNPPDEYFYVQARIGGELGVAVSDDVELVGGLMLENLPVYDLAEWETRCTTDDLGNAACSGSAPDAVADDAWVFGPYVGLAYRLGRFTLLGQVFAMTGDDRIAPHVPLVGQLVLRVEVDAPTYPAGSARDPYRGSLR